MKLLIILILGITMAACTSTTDKTERISREPVQYWNYVEEENTFVEDTVEEDEGNIYYWNYRGEE